MKRLIYPTMVVAIFIVRAAEAQILFGSGTYSQNFDSLATASSFWTNNVTLPGWYASKAGADNTNTLAGAGTSTTGGVYSFATNGVNAATDRALGSLASAGNTYAFGVRFTNDTPFAQTNLTIAYTGEQWRNGGSGVVETDAFYYAVSSAPITNSFSAATWINFSPLNFTSRITSASSAPLDGNVAANRQAFTNVVLTGVVVQPGQELFLRWADTDDTGLDDALAVDDLTVAFSATAGSTNAAPAAVPTNGIITLLTYNVKGNGSTDWSTNTPQVQAIGRELLYLQPDVITFNEIPYTNTWQMTNWVTAFLPGFFLATNSGTDGFIRSVIASRFWINRFQSWLQHADLNPFGYTNANFTRDLFEAEINVPNWPLPLHVFATHLKSSTSGYTDAAAKRAAEAAAITNFLATNFFALHPGDPFTLSGDMNESDINSLAIQKLISAPNQLQLINPVNPVSGSSNTYSIQGSLSERIDFIFPCGLLGSNLMSSQVFRTDLLSPLPPLLNADDDSVASDHLPVLMTFANPFNTPFKLLSLTRNNQNIALQWESATNRVYRVDTSSNLMNWVALATNLFSTGSIFNFSTSQATDQMRLFRVRRAP